MYLVWVSMIQTVISIPTSLNKQVFFGDVLATKFLAVFMTVPTSEWKHLFDLTYCRVDLQIKIAFVLTIKQTSNLVVKEFHEHTSYLLFNELYEEYNLIIICSYLSIYTFK